MEESNILSARNMRRLFIASSCACLLLESTANVNPKTPVIVPTIPAIMLTMINVFSIYASCNQAALDRYRKGDFDNNITIDNLQLRMVENAPLCRFFGHLP